MLRVLPEQCHEVGCSPVLVTGAETAGFGTTFCAPVAGVKVGKLTTVGT
jgi:hypothetical protein